MMKVIHPVAGTIAILTIATFWLSTAVTELLASQAIVTAVKTAIPWGFLLSFRERSANRRGHHPRSRS